MTMDEGLLLADLDDVQRAAVTSSAQPLVILAPAGSGKTRVLTRRIAHRVATGTADARHVLAITFTRKAAAEMAARLARLGLRDQPTAGTFHAVAWGMLRTWWSDQGRSPLALVEDRSRLLADGTPRGSRPARAALRAVATEVDWAKARQIPPERYADAARASGRRSGAKPEAVADAYAAYESRKRAARLVDFDDVLTHCARALERDAGFAAAQRWRFRHLFVDELQDVSPLQFRFLEALRGQQVDVTAVGDPQQSIYGWNGADPSFLLDIQRHWPAAEVIELVRTYRSTPQILTAADGVLRGARQPVADTTAARPDGPLPRLRAHPNDRTEAVAVARAVRLAHAPGRAWGDQAVLVRTHAQLGFIAEALREDRIPHRLHGGSTFVDDPEVRAALRRLRSTDEPLGTALADLDADHADSRGPDGGQAGDADALATLVDMGRDLLRVDPSARTRSFEAWVRATVQSAGVTSGGRDAVDLATFHAAKGLEWGVVHLAGVEDGFVPVAHARTASERHEEARLLYVAMTRAQRELRMTWARERSFSGKVLARRCSPYVDGLTEAGLLDAGDDSPVIDLREARRHDARGTLPVPTPQATHDPREALKRWRAATARAARIPPEAVLADHVMARIVEEAPSDVGGLGAIRGVGSIMASRFGPAILSALHDTTGEP